MYKAKEYGLTITEKWSSKDTVSAEACVEDKPIDGLKNTIKCSYDTKSGAVRNTLKSDFKRDIYHATMDVNFRNMLPEVSHSLVARLVTLCYCLNVNILVTRTTSWVPISILIRQVKS